MSSRKKLNRYPPEFQDILERAIQRPQALFFRTPEAATAMRRELYNFRYALRKAVKNSGDIQTGILLWKANRLSFRVKAERLTIGEAYRLNGLNDHEQYTLRPRSGISDTPGQHPDNELPEL